LAAFKPKNQIDMSDINFIIAKKDELKSLIYQWLDEHPHFLFQASEKEKESDKPMSRPEIAEYLGISKVTVTDWMKKGLPYKRMNGRVYFIKEDVLAAMPTFNHRKNSFIKLNDSKK
jgi:excisionase family DNA binding protein